MAKQPTAKMFALLGILAALSVNATPGSASVVDQMKDRLLTAASQDDAAAYRQLRSEALALPDEQFAALLDALGKIDSWQAMAMQEGLRLRKKQPALAADFDDRLNEAIDRRQGRRDLGTSYVMIPNVRDGVRGLLPTPEHDALRFEAVLAVSGALEPGTPYDSLRISLLGLHGLDADTLAKFVALLEDNPDWIDIRSLCRSIRARSRDVGAIDPYLPRIVKLYPDLRRDPAPIAMDAVRPLIHALGRASADVGLPALRQIEQFERTNMAEQGFAPWDHDMKAIHASRAADYSRLQQISRASRQIQDGQVNREFEQEAKVLQERMAQTRIRMAATHLWDDIQKALSEMVSRAEGENK
jgi:hypothetical protein